jgi:hypothetical protein
MADCVSPRDAAQENVMRLTAPLLALSLSLILLCAPPRHARAAAAAAAADKPPELKLLERWVGTWDSQWTAKPATWTPQGGTFTGVETVDWVLGGRFTNARIATQPGNKHATSLTTYDPKAKAYRSWWFSSDGHQSQSAGQWDEASQTLTMKSDIAGGIKGTTTSHFTADGVFDWTVVIKGDDGTTYIDMSGKTTRRKAAGEGVSLRALSSDAPAAARAELKPLSHFAGAWDTSVTARPAQWTPKEVTTKGFVRTGWALGGNFLVEHGRSFSESDDHVIITGYDRQARAYRSWFFDALGTANDTPGQWDEASKTFTWKTPPADGGTGTATHRFSADDAYEWSYVIKDGAGKLLLDTQGKHTRRK